MAWDYTPKEYEKQAQAEPWWDLERAINYGLEGKKLDPKILQKYLPELRIPAERKVFLELLLWNKPF